MAMALPRIATWRTTASMVPLSGARGFRSDAALDAIAKAQEEKVPNVVLYNYPSFSGAFSALFAHLFHSRLKLPCLILPFSSVVPFRVEDFFVEGLERCYLLDFLGPKGFVDKLLQRSMCEIIAFDHRKSVISQIPSPEDCPQKLTLHFDPEKSSSSAVYSYFSDKLANMISHDNKGEVTSLLNSEDQGRVEMILQYIEDIDLRKWRSPNSRAFSDGLAEWRSKLNCSTNQYMFEQLLGINSSELIAKGNVNISSCQNAASKLLDKAFKLRLGRGFYGECLGIRADGNSNLSGEIGKQLSVKSVASGLRPIGAVIYMQRNNLKMCLRSTDSATDTSEIAKAYGGGGSPSASSFIIRMDEFNLWLSLNACQSYKCARNKLIHANSILSISDIKFKAALLSSSVSSIHAPSTPSRSRHSNWCAPAAGKFKINVDTAWSSSTSSAGVGAVIRGSRGEVIAAGFKKIPFAG